jgi:hypothetical protein
VIASDDDDDRVRQLLSQPRELRERVKDCGVRGADVVKEITGDDGEVRPQLDHLVHGPPE